MLRPRWRKVLADLWGNKLRSLLVVSTVFIGVFAVGMTTSIYGLMAEDMAMAYDQANYYHAVVYASPFDAETVARLRSLPGVKVAEGRRSVAVEAWTPQGEWYPITLNAIDDIGNSQIQTLHLQAGAFPPGEREIVVERSSLSALGVKAGDTLRIRLNDGVERYVTVRGVIFDSDGPSYINARGYIDYANLEWLHTEPFFTQLFLQVEGNFMDRQHVQAISDMVAEQLRRSGQIVWTIYIPQPGIVAGSDQILGVAAVLAFLGLLAVMLGGFLVFNTLAALLAQHIKQIGVMKAVGARTRQIVGLYLILILVYAFIATLPAIPVAALVAHEIEALVLTQFNFDYLGLRVVPSAVGLQLFVGFFVPLAAGFFPVLSGARVTIHKALSSYGVNGGRFGSNLIDRLVERLRFLPRPQLISLRNTFRRKGRLLLTLSTLVLGGAIFISVFTVQASLNTFTNTVAKYVSADVSLNFDRPYRYKEVEPLARSIPGVEDVEGWIAINADVLEPDASPGEDAALDSTVVFGPPHDSRFVPDEVLEGRWLLPGDENAIVVSTAWYRVFPDLKIGDTLRLRILERESEWKVVGVMQWLTAQQLIAYAGDKVLAETIHMPGQVFQLRITSGEGSFAAQKELARQVDLLFKERGFGIGAVETGGELIQANASSLASITLFFMILAIIIAVVGAIGLTGTMSMNVMERTREIGVMRAIGARDRTILNIVLTEGLLIGLWSWIGGALLAVPMSQLMYGTLSQAVFKIETVLVFDPSGFLIWLIVAVGLAAAASLLPAYSATRLTVREVLAYE